jgi:uncharacterized iron-regulated membrane protein
MEPSLARRGRRSSHDLPSRLRRALFLIHRWLGVALALVMALWAASGIVMMYVAYPATSPEERMGGLEPLDMGQCCAALPAFDGVEAAAVEMLDGRPMLRVITTEGPAMVDLRTGKQPAIDAGVAERVARTYLARSTGAAPRWQVRPTAQDQWTVSGEFRAHAPLYKAAADDDAGTVLYVSGVTGQVVQDTTRSERFWNWLGAIPHWLYFKQLRANAPLWSQVVIYASLLGSFLTAIGLYIGVVQLKRGKRWIPYRGMGWWHHVTGLVFGVLTLTWVASGLFSMNPWGWMASEGPGAELAALAGRPATTNDVAALVRALAAAPSSGAVRAELSVQGGKAYAIVSEPSGLRWRASLPALASAPLRPDELDTLAARARPGTVASAGLIRAEDAYHYAHHDSVVLPVWRIVYADGQRMRLYFDPRTGELVDYVDGPIRTYRWWHSALHSFDFAPVLRARPVWDIVVLPLMAGVTILCLIGLWLGVRRLGRTIKKRETRITTGQNR